MDNKLVRRPFGDTQGWAMKVAGRKARGADLWLERTSSSSHQPNPNQEPKSLDPPTPGTS